MNWSVLWRTWVERDVREFLVLPLIVLIILVPIGLFTGTVLLFTVNSVCNDCFGYRAFCPCIELSLLRGTIAVRIQSLVTNGVVLTLRLSLQREFTEF